MATNRPQLLRLPAELRNDIYPLVLTSSEPITISERTGLIQPPLLKVCQKNTAETTQLYYVCNTFMLRPAPSTCMKVARWICALDRETCQAFKAIVLAPDQAADEAGVRYSYCQSQDFSPPASVPPKNWRRVCRAMLRAGIRGESISVQGFRSGLSGGFSSLANRWVEKFDEEMETALGKARRALKI